MPKRTAAEAGQVPPGGPRLLAGGNPQIPKGDGEGPVQAYLAALPGWKEAVGRRVDALIVAALPEVKKVVRWNSPFYSTDGRTYIINMHCLTKYLKIAFFSGAKLDPPPPVESSKEDVRYLHIFEDDEMDEAQFTAWVKQAAELPGLKC